MPENFQAVLHHAVLKMFQFCSSGYLKLLVAILKMHQQYSRSNPIDGLQSIPRDPNGKDVEVAAMLVELTIAANEESFVIILQHGSIDVHVTCMQSAV